MSSAPARSPSWKWWVCGLLLLATTINYMDRLTLNLQTETIRTALGIEKEVWPKYYGLLEAAFGSAFAIGAIIMGWLADRINVRWLYAVAVLLWSLAGMATGFVDGFVMLLLCRFALGFAEAGNWPCALRTTQHILPPEQRTFGNSILQSGAAFGAILTPLLIRWMTPEKWRLTFILVGALGMFWVIAWLLLVRQEDLELPKQPPGRSLMEVVGWLVGLLVVDTLVHLRLPDTAWPLISKAIAVALGIIIVVRWMMLATADDDALPRDVFFWRYLGLAGVVVAINITWHFFRAWLSPYLIHEHGYTELDAANYIMWYYVASDVGSLSAGFLVLMIAKSFGVHGSRLLIFGLFSGLTLLSLVAARVNSGGPLEVLLAAIGFGSLGLFPIYYTLSQEITRKNQGKVTGSLGCINWLAMSLLQEAVGVQVSATKSYTLGVSLAGVPPILALGLLMLVWGRTTARPTSK